jgi:hypothetical protein
LHFGILVVPFNAIEVLMSALVEHWRLHIEYGFQKGQHGAHSNCYKSNFTNNPGPHRIHGTVPAELRMKASATKQHPYAWLLLHSPYLTWRQCDIDRRWVISKKVQLATSRVYCNGVVPETVIVPFKS